jgi:hypothetical protein
LALSGWYFDSDAAACGTSKRRETDIVVINCVNAQQRVGATWRAMKGSGRKDRRCETHRHTREGAGSFEP